MSTTYLTTFNKLRKAGWLTTIRINLQSFEIELKKMISMTFSSLDSLRSVNQAIFNRSRQLKCHLNASIKTYEQKIHRYLINRLHNFIEDKSDKIRIWMMWNFLVRNLFVFYRTAFSRLSLSWLHMIWLHTIWFMHWTNVCFVFGFIYSFHFAEDSPIGEEKKSK